MSETLEELDDEAWASLSTPDVYFTRDYHAAASLTEPDFYRRVLLRWTSGKDSVYLPLLLRKIPNTSYFDATSAYGYGGPWKEHPGAVTGELRGSLDEWAKKNNVVATFLRYHPLINNSSFTQCLEPNFVGSTAVWNLEKSRDLYEGMAKDHRKTWRRSAREGVETRIVENPSNLDDFVSIYNKSMSRLRAGGFYFFGDSYWYSLVNYPDLKTVQVDALLNGEVIASLLVLRGKTYMHFHLSGTTDAGRQAGAAVACRLAAAQWGQKMGLLYAHSGGGFGGDSSPLLEWKRRFDPATPLHEFHVAKLTHDQRAFEHLAGTLEGATFFPPWRQS